MTIPINNICHSVINGPGNRLVFWVQGCPFRCEGCFNPETHEMGSGILMDVDEVIRIINEEKGIDGITFSGGEPLLYLDALKAIADEVRPELTKILYSGYTDKEILANEKMMRTVASYDVAIVGRYKKELLHPYFGKKFFLMTNRIDINEFLPRQKIEYSISGNGVTKTGIFKT